MSQLTKQFIAICLSIGLVWFQLSPAYAQENNEIFPEAQMTKPQVPMENVFFNVLWGSLTGGMLMMGWAMLDDAKPSSERYTLSNASKQFLSGATYGGLLGLAAGIYISFKGVTFDESRLKIAFLKPPIPLPDTHSQEGSSPIHLGSSNLDLIQLKYDF